MRLIAAADRNFGIGKDGALLAHIPEDMKFFREMTTGKTVIMGRKTLESFPGKKPLPRRRNLVLSRDLSYAAEGAEVYHSVDELLTAVADEKPEDLFVIGGGEIYRLFLPYCDTAYITVIDRIFPCDTTLPDLDQDPEWTVCEESPVHQAGDLSYRFRTYRKIIG